MFIEGQAYPIERGMVRRGAFLTSTPVSPAKVTSDYVAELKRRQDAVQIQLDQLRAVVAAMTVNSEKTGPGGTARSAVYAPVGVPGAGSKRECGVRALSP